MFTVLVIGFVGTGFAAFLAVSVYGMAPTAGLAAPALMFVIGEVAVFILATIVAGSVREKYVPQVERRERRNRR